MPTGWKFSGRIPGGGPWVPGGGICIFGGPNLWPGGGPNVPNPEIKNQLKSIKKTYIKTNNCE